MHLLECSATGIAPCHVPANESNSVVLCRVYAGAEKVHIPHLSLPLVTIGELTLHSDP